ncbi:MAG: hypothetical protein A2Z97_08710 [Bdellovibrionales bacterium GWB1_52_6]|nr:MAG: hypothetical protein A2Z97_08710 [Bdellovibrionales bacterium GWB1_52_6]
MELGAIFEKWRELRYRSGSSRIECFDEGDFTRSFGIREAYRELVHRPLTAEQAKRWTAQLRKLESEFKADVYANDDNSREPTHALLMVLSPRKLRRIVP